MKHGQPSGKVVEPSELEPFELWGSSWCSQEVVGESHYSEHLQRLFGDAGARHREVETVALLVPEADNSHDPNAVSVRIDGGTVGYLPRETAAGYHVTLLELAGRGRVAQVRCRIWGGLIGDFETDRAGRIIERERFAASVTIALAESHLCLPVNAPPVEPHVLLPDGAAIQVGGEDQCMPAIEPHLRPEGTSYAYATLHQITSSTGKEVAEVRIDGERVGQLTPKMSSELLPAVRHLGRERRLAVVKAKVRGNQLKAEVTLHCARAHELAADWPEPGRLNASAGSSVVSMPDRRPVDGHQTVPPKPARIVFVPAPGWPEPPADWEPEPGWRPDPAWPPAPPGWSFWVAR